MSNPTSDNTSTNKNALTPGTKLKGNLYEYTIKKVLGSGSFGITYQALVQLEGALGSIKTKVAIKEFYMGDINGRNGSQVTSGNKDGIVSDYRKKFIREANSLGEVSHENIIDVMEVFECNGTVYYSMQYIEGGSLDARIAKLGRLKQTETVSMAEKISSALKELHTHGMVHLDLKPANIMLSEDLSPILIDFGIAKHFDDNGAPESSTKIGAGTPGYSPVEQASYRAGRGIPVTMDIYALGATMYKMLTGKRPPEASNILNGLSDINADLEKAGIEPDLRAMVVKCMSPLIRERYQNIDEVIAALKSIEQTVAKADAEITETEKNRQEAAKLAEEQKRKEQESKAEQERQQRAREDKVRAEETVVRVKTAPPAVKAENSAGVYADVLDADSSRQMPGVTPPDYVSGYDTESKKKSKVLPIAIGCVVGLAIAGAVVYFAVGKNSKPAEGDNSGKTAEQQSDQSGNVTDMNYVGPLGDCTYTGEVNAEGLPDGNGVAVFPKPTGGNVGPVKYDGQWVNGQMEGEAYYELSNGDTFKGEWKNSRFSKGRYTSKSDGSYYEGDFDAEGNFVPGKGHWHDKNGKVLPD